MCHLMVIGFPALKAYSRNVHCIAVGYVCEITDILVSRRGRLVTCSSGNAVRLWSVVNVSEIKHAAQHSSNGSALGVTMEDEMTLDAPASSASFDDTLDMVIHHLSH